MGSWSKNINLLFDFYKFIQFHISCPSFIHGPFFNSGVIFVYAQACRFDMRSNSEMGLRFKFLSIDEDL